MMKIDNYKMNQYLPGDQLLGDNFDDCVYCPQPFRPEQTKIKNFLTEKEEAVSLEICSIISQSYDSDSCDLSDYSSHESPSIESEEDLSEDEETSGRVLTNIRTSTRSLRVISGSPTQDYTPRDVVGPTLGDSFTDLPFNVAPPPRSRNPVTLNAFFDIESRGSRSVGAELGLLNMSPVFGKSAPVSLISGINVPYVRRSTPVYNGKQFSVESPILEP
eukprot:TRINITY_DN10525_c0_g1_i1.p1 TRINITY_DN10525_c0_g1~~TRINITY_DN10525_c0_g1_i1.p1  ORF type:complete len:218 (+),score=63.11 TRINITY_DN10525_c0_g1_i1:86-739(+)